MRSPKTFPEFKALILQMPHRERYIFEVLNPNDDEGTEIEVYTTFRIDEGKEPKFNLHWHFRDSLGKHREGMNSGDKRFSLLTDSYLQTIYSWIKT